MYLFLNSRKSPIKARRLIDSMYRAACDIGISCEMADGYRKCDVLVLYGLGGGDRYQVGLDHMAKGKLLLTWDIGYWDRKHPHRKYRFSINGFHPKNIMDGPYPGGERWDKSGLDITSIDPKGPIMLVGNAPKSISVGAGGWSAEKSKQIRAMFPDKKIVYRPKPKRPMENGVICDKISTDDIDSALTRVSLVVCRHSNVAVDACRLGVPVVCDDGAAACIYPSKLEDYQNQPDIHRRTEFLHRLAYWQWAESESCQFWDWFFQTFPAYRN